MALRVQGAILFGKLGLICCFAVAGVGGCGGGGQRPTGAACKGGWKNYLCGRLISKTLTGAKMRVTPESISLCSGRSTKSSVWVGIGNDDAKNSIQVGYGVVFGLEEVGRPPYPEHHYYYECDFRGFDPKKSAM